MLDNPTLEIHVGPMFSGKSQELFRQCSKIADALAGISGKEVDHVLLILYKGQSDRATESKFTHASNYKASSFLKIREVNYLKEISEDDLKNVKYIGIDECFYPDLYERVMYWFL